MDKSIQDLLDSEEYEGDTEEEPLEIPTRMTEWRDPDLGPSTIEREVNKLTKFGKGDLIRPIKGGRAIEVTGVLRYSEKTYSYRVSVAGAEMVYMSSIEAAYEIVKD